MAKPLVSIVIPTLNASRVLPACLASIAAQDLIGDAELLVADAGSADDSREIALRFGARVVDNPLRTAEAGKAVGVRSARGEYLAFVDSDNILPDQNWLGRMLAPFNEPDIVGAEPVRFTVRRSDHYLTRYFAGLGMNDPVCLFLGNYDRCCLLTGNWTGMPIQSTPRNGYEKVWLFPRKEPTIGANGFIVRRAPLVEVGVGDYFFDTDVVRQLVAQRRWAFAKVNCGIIHLFVNDVGTFRRKQRRRITDFRYYRRQALRADGARPGGGGLALFIMATLLGWPLIWQTGRAVLRSGDPAWFFHPAACVLTLYEYSTGVLLDRGRTGPFERREWEQC